MKLLILLLSFCLFSLANESIKSKKFHDIQIKDDFDGVILDIRTPREWKRTGIIKNSLTKNFYDTNFKSYVSKLDKKKKYYIYCHSGGRSAKALKLMSEIGLDVIDISDGITGWLEAKYKVKKYID